MKVSTRLIMVPLAGLLVGLMAGVVIKSAFDHSRLPESLCRAQHRLWVPDLYAEKGLFRDEFGQRHIGTEVTTIFGCFDDPLFAQRDQRDQREAREVRR